MTEERLYLIIKKDVSRAIQESSTKITKAISNIYLLLEYGIQYDDKLNYLPHLKTFLKQADKNSEKILKMFSEILFDEFTNKEYSIFQYTKILYMADCLMEDSQKEKIQCFCGCNSESETRRGIAYSLFNAYAEMTTYQEWLRIRKKNCILDRFENHSDDFFKLVKVVEKQSEK